MKNKFNRRKILILLCFLIGAWQLSYSGYLYAKASVAQYLILSAWNQSIEDQTDVKPWSWADTWPVARLVVPAHDEDMIVLAGDSGHALAFGPGHRLGSAMPGENGNTVISAHRDTHFQFLQHLKKGDEIVLQNANGKTHSYLVQRVKIVDQSTPLYSDETQTQLTLVTCFPFNTLEVGGRLRYVVTARKIQKV